jgi:pilus assembly protein CpaB
MSLGAPARGRVRIGRHGAVGRDEPLGRSSASGPFSRLDLVNRSGPSFQSGPLGRLSGGSRWGPVSRRRRWRRTVAARILSAVLAAVAVWLVVSALLPTPADPGLATVVLTRDLPIGATLTEPDLRVERRVEAERPSGAMSAAAAAVGQELAGPVLAGEILTSARFRGPDSLMALPVGTLAVSLPVGSSGLVSALHPGDRVAVLVAGTGASVATSALVLATDLPSSGMGGSGGASAHVVVALSAQEAQGAAVALGGPDAAGFVLGLRR